MSIIGALVDRPCRLSVARAVSVCVPEGTFAQVVSNVGRCVLRATLVVPEKYSTRST